MKLFQMSCSHTSVPGLRLTVRTAAFLLLPLAFVRLASSAAFDTFDNPGTVIAIHLGSTYSSIAVTKNDGQVEVIFSDQGSRITPSYGAFIEEGGYPVGDTANPLTTIFDVFRLIGRKFRVADDQAENEKRLPDEVISESSKPQVEVDVNGQQKRLAPKQISATILGKMKGVAESYLDKKITHAVVAVPVHFNNFHQAIKDGGRIAGLDILRIIDEPTAVATAYSEYMSDPFCHIIVCNFGGKTFEVSLMLLDSSVFELLATASDTFLGGEDDGRADSAETRTRTKPEELDIDLFKKTIALIDNVLKEANVTKFDDIVLVGAPSHIPSVQRVQSFIEEHFSRKAFQRIKPDEAVAVGAAMQADILSDGQSPPQGIFMDVTPLSLGIETTGGIMATLVSRYSPIPTRKRRVFSTAKDDQTAILVRVFEGECLMTKNNNMLGTFELRDIPPAPRGVPQFEVSFELDGNGVLQVSAHDMGTGKQQSITIASSDRLSQAGIDDLLIESERCIEQEKDVRERIAARGGFENLTLGLDSRVEESDLHDEL